MVRNYLIPLTTLAWIILAGAAPLAAQPASQPDAAFVNEIASPLPVREVVRPRPRSLDLPDAFPARSIHTLNPIPDDAVVDYHGNPPKNGQVDDWPARSDVDGQWSDLPEGGRLWTLELESPNAAGLRVRFEQLALPEGAELILYNADRPEESYGPYGRREAVRGEVFWSPTVFGRRVHVELYLPATADPAIAKAVRITGVAQIYPDPPGERTGCQLDVTCFPDWQTTAQSVAHIAFISGGESFICSGAMINRLPSADFCPLFLTAAHCIDTDAEAASIDVFWFFQTATCNGPPPDKYTLPRTQWATCLTVDSDADNSLLGLQANAIPGGVVWAGWSSGVAPDPTPAALIHHPLGMRKSFSWGDLLGIEDISQCFGTAYDTYDFELVDGGQDGGSSGAPVFDVSNHRIRAVATCSESDECIPDEDTGEGSLAHAYDTLAEYLNASSNVWVVPYTPPCQDGSQGCPWDTLLEGYYGVFGGGTIHIVAGSYPAINFDGTRAMTLVAEGGTVTIGN
jgi:hypothetical protein